MTMTKPITAPLMPPPPPRSGFGELRAGQLGVRIASRDAERDAAQALR